MGGAPAVARLAAATTQYGTSACHSDTVGPERGPGVQNGEVDKEPMSLMQTQPADVARRVRAERLKGQVLVIQGAVLFDEQGKSGVWDVLEKHVGVRNPKLPRMVMPACAMTKRMAAQDHHLTLE